MAFIPARPGKLILFLKHIYIFYCPQSVETALVRGSDSHITPPGTAGRRTNANTCTSQASAPANNNLGNLNKKKYT